MRLYLDSNVFLSYVLKEFGNIEDFMENTAQEFFVVCAEENHVLILSDLFFIETTKKGFHTKKEVVELISSFGIKIESTKGNKNDWIQTRKIQDKYNIHEMDAYHVRMAINSQSDYIITWNLKDFKKSPVKAVSPTAFKKTFSVS